MRRWDGWRPLPAPGEGLEYDAVRIESSGVTNGCSPLLQRKSPRTPAVLRMRVKCRAWTLLMDELSDLPQGGQAERAWSRSPRTLAERRAHVLRVLESENKLWIATVSSDGSPHVVPFSYVWDGRQITMATLAGSKVAQNAAHSPRARLAFGSSGDVVLVDGELRIVGSQEIDARTAERLAWVSAVDARRARGLIYLQLTPERIQAWWCIAELSRPAGMRDGVWLGAAAT